jgi:hypothetical protein
MRSSDKKHILRLVGIIIGLGVFALGVTHISEADNDNANVIIGLAIVIVSILIPIGFYKWSNA